MSNNKQDIDSILLANLYCINCQRQNNFGCQEVARKYLTRKINKALIEREKIKSIRAPFYMFFN